ncbi:carboxypeptidase-like regulatory domain-containing protein [bacterium]|nr:carboxypeptidase-like regulatory domain-containing protein [bacterium]
MNAYKMIAGLLVFSILTTAGVSAQTGMGVGWIKGQVVEEGTGQPIAGANVIYLAEAKFSRGVVTDEKGNFLTAHVDQGMVLGVVIKAEGFYDLSKEVIVGDGATEVLFELINTDKYKEELEKKMAASVQKSRTFRIEYRDAMEIFGLIKSISCARSASRELQTITGMGTEESLSNLGELIKQYDTPLQQVWLEVLLIKATGNGGGKPEYPAEIKSIVSKLNSLFKFGRYTIIGRANAMGLEGATLSFSGRIENDPEAMVENPFMVQTRLGAAGDVIKLEGLKVMITMPRNEIATSINVKNGETVILGASRGKSSEDALITVVTAKIME